MFVSSILNRSRHIQENHAGRLPFVERVRGVLHDMEDLLDGIVFDLEIELIVLDDILIIQCPVKFSQHNNFCYLSFAGRLIYL